MGSFTAWGEAALHCEVRHSLCDSHLHLQTVRFLSKAAVGGPYSEQPPQFLTGLPILQPGYLTATPLGPRTRFR